MKKNEQKTRSNIFQQEQKRFLRSGKLKLLLLTIVLITLWFVPKRNTLSPEEGRLWDRVHSAEIALDEWRNTNGWNATPEDNPWNLGLIGIEWSPLTTTLGSLESKRTACNPYWSIQTLKWFEQLDLQEGDKIAIYSSSSFPGMLLNVLAAAEQKKLDIFLIVSLGSSTWGANSPHSPWPVISHKLRTLGYIRTKAQYYTLGGESEIGESLSPEGLAIMEKVSKDSSVNILKTSNLQEMIELKFNLLRSFSPRVLINIGGSHATMGDDEDIISIPGGLLLPSENLNAGNGVIAKSLNEGIPVIHFLNLKRLSQETGISFNSKPVKRYFTKGSPVTSIIGITIFCAILLTNKRWDFGSTMDQ